MVFSYFSTPSSICGYNNFIVSDSFYVISNPPNDFVRQIQRIIHIFQIRLLRLRGVHRLLRAQQLVNEKADSRRSQRQLCLHGLLLCQPCFEEQDPSVLKVTALLRHPLPHGSLPWRLPGTPPFAAENPEACREELPRPRSHGLKWSH